MSGRYGVQCGPFSGTIWAGKVNGGRFIDKEDVTGQVLRAVSDFAMKTGDGTIDLILIDGRRLTITATNPETNP